MHKHKKAALLELAKRYGASWQYPGSERERPSAQLRSLTADAQFRLAVSSDARLTSDQGSYYTQLGYEPSVEYRNPDPGKKQDYQTGRISISDKSRN